MIHSSMPARPHLPDIEMLAARFCEHFEPPPPDPGMLALLLRLARREQDQLEAGVQEAEAALHRSAKD